jgi:hypothetical protein
MKFNKEPSHVFLDKNMNIWIKSFFIAFLVICSIFLSLIAVNYAMPLLCKECRPGFITQAVDTGIFNSKYIYWGKSYCKNSTCKKEVINNFLTSEPVFINENYGKCETLLFLGDSFTESPWDNVGKSYAEHFAINLSEKNHSCYKLLRMAMSGVGNDQQLARFSDVVKFLKPKLVVWQFYWNDFYDNVEKPLYSLDNGKLIRHKSYKIAYFWAGWLNQKIPFMSGSKLGDFFLYFGELRKDFTSDWYRIENDLPSLYSFNEQKITAFLQEMDNLEKKYNFKLVTTVSPLECEFIFIDGCSKLDELDPIPYSVFSEIQGNLTSILKAHSNFISMYENNYSSQEDQLNASDFWGQETVIGARHLGASGQEKAGKTLFLNFFSKGESI